MNGADLIRAVDFVHREKNIPKEVIFASIEKAVRLAIHKCYEDDEDLVAVNIDRQSGNIVAQKGERTLEPEELGRIAAQSAKQMIIQNFREEESNSVFNEYQALKGDLITGTVQRFDGGAATVRVGKAEALVPPREQLPGETRHVNEADKAVIPEGKKHGHPRPPIPSR